MKNHSNAVPQKENGNSPETKLTVIKYYDLTDKEFKMFFMKKLSKLQEKSESQTNELRNKTSKQKKIPETLKLKKDPQTETPELKNPVNVKNNALESFGNRLDCMKERISRLDDRNLEMLQVYEEREIR